ncbi:MAG: hypothetical protein LBN33_09925 [Desulfovibrio sp.]|jgi:hypothetical protein|nr:hypothetical protein [Desulfovibrio sp.]
MRLLIILPILAFVALTSAGCASDGSLKNPFSSDPAPAQSAPSSNYFFSEFNDIPIPNELSENRGDTFITFAPSGVKCGVQHFSGRVELVSLMNTMRRNMASNGWKLRSLLRAKESVMVFDKTDRMAAFQISDGMVTTDMRIFVTSRLEGDAPPADPTYSTGSSQPITQ